MRIRLLIYYLFITPQASIQFTQISINKTFIMRMQQFSFLLPAILVKTLKNCTQEKNFPFKNLKFFFNFLRRQLKFKFFCKLLFCDVGKKNSNFFNFQQIICSNIKRERKPLQHDSLFSSSIWKILSCSISISAVLLLLFIMHMENIQARERERESEGKIKVGK